jgi:transcriptional regulator with XRE-family HTH domain
LPYFVNYFLQKTFKKQGVRHIYELLRAEIAKQKKLQKKTSAQLADMAGLTKATVEAFMCGVRGTEKTADALAKALGIER